MSTKAKTRTDTKLDQSESEKKNLSFQGALKIPITSGFKKKKETDS